MHLKTGPSFIFTQSHSIFKNIILFTCIKCISFEPILSLLKYKGKYETLNISCHNNEIIHLLHLQILVSKPACSVFHEERKIAISLKYFYLDYQINIAVTVTFTTYLHLKSSVNIIYQMFLRAVFCAYQLTFLPI